MFKKLMIVLLTTMHLFARIEEKKYPYIMNGNLALPPSQQIVPLISFGQNIIDKGDTIAVSVIDYLKGKNRKRTEVILGILHGVSDRSSLLAIIPVAAKFRENNQCSSGIEDCVLQAEYAFFQHTCLTYANQATVVGSIGFPTGSSKKQPVTGSGSPSFFLGATVEHLSIDWYCFLDSGALITTNKRGTKFGDVFLYQGGFGRNIAYKSHHWIFTCLVEFDGRFAKRDRIDCQWDPNSGGNTISIAPSLWFSTQHFYLQAGIAFPILQHLNGIQNKNCYFAALSIGYTFK